MESASVAAGGRPERAEQTGEKGLKKNAIGFVDGLCIGLASTAPAYSIVVGTHGESPIRGAILGSTPDKLLHLRAAGAGGVGQRRVRAASGR